MGVTEWLIQYRDVVLTREGRPVLDGATGDVPASGITVVVGPSGSGKSTLLRLANRLDAADGGMVITLGEDVAAQETMMLRRRVGMVFQKPTLFPGSVLDNLRIAEPTIDRSAGEKVLARAALGPGLLDRAEGLSGGEAQRVCVARALAAEPVALLMDEPTSSLDSRSRDEIEELARSLSAGGLPIVWVTHDLGQMHRLADHVLVVVNGRIAFSGEPTLASAYLEAAGSHAR